jgi:hypothetical protein
MSAARAAQIFCSLPLGVAPARRPDASIQITKKRALVLQSQSSIGIDPINPKNPLHPYETSVSVAFNLWC